MEGVIIRLNCLQLLHLAVDPGNKIYLSISTTLLGMTLGETYL